MFQDIEDRLARAFEQQLRAKFQIEQTVALEQPKQAGFGELAVPVAFQLARQLKKAPKQIAELLLDGLEPVPGVATLEVAGNGYINVRLDRAAYAQGLALPTAATRPTIDRCGKIIVEHTNINPNKAAHIGHLRNAILGDTFVRMLRQSGEHVEVQNYIDNTGVQVADVVVAFRYVEKKTSADVQLLIDNPTIRFDYLCWDLYARISALYKQDPAALTWRSETLHAIEAGKGELAQLAHIVADAIVKAHLVTMYRLGVEYDVLPRESEILHLQFWATAFELLKQRGAIYFETEGKNKGCWVMPAAAFRESAAQEEAQRARTRTARQSNELARPSGGALDSATASRDSSEISEGTDDSKVIVRSNGTVTYVGKDIAYQLWKFGLLGKDFFYRPWSVYPDGHQVWVSSDRPSDQQAPHFGGAAKVYNVIDSRQSYLQDVVVAGLRALGFGAQADASIHFSYEMVALSPRTCAQMGIPLSEEDKGRPYVEVSGRKGLGVKADDLVDQLIETALVEVESRHPEEPADKRRHVAKQIAIGALRYFMLKFTRNSVIAFDLQEALAFEGETGPYTQYSAVRAANILRKYAERFGGLPAFETVLNMDTLKNFLGNDSFWQLLLLASKSGSAIERAVASGEPAHLAKYAFQLGQAFNNFYHDQRVITEEDETRRILLLWLTKYLHSQLVSTLEVLGISVPEYM